VTAANAPDGGAVFTMRLTLVPSPAPVHHSLPVAVPDAETAPERPAVSARGAS
jgi:hypothetical protein